jgi:hypothetical protein
MTKRVGLGIYPEPSPQSYIYEDDEDRFSCVDTVVSKRGEKI